jgi:hypothetical protein
MEKKNFVPVRVPYLYFHGDGSGPTWFGSGAVTMQQFNCSFLKGRLLLIFDVYCTRAHINEISEEPCCTRMRITYIALIRFPGTVTKGRKQ